MQGDPGVLELLNEVLTAELTAVNQYFIHAKQQDNWGYRKLASYTRSESIDEMKHAESVIDRILYLDGTPNMQRYFPVAVGEDVKEQLEKDLELEQGAIDRLNRGIAQCVAAGDNGSRELLEGILVSEEEHADWLETQLETIRQVGEQLWLSTWIHD